MSDLNPSQRNVIAICPTITIPKENRPEDARAIIHRKMVAGIGQATHPEKMHRLDDVLREMGELPCHNLRCFSSRIGAPDVFTMYFRAKVALAQFEAVEAEATIAIREGTYGEHGGPWSQRRDKAARVKNSAVEACLRTPAATLSEIRNYKRDLAREAAMFGHKGYWLEIIEDEEAQLRATKARPKSTG